MKNKKGNSEDGKVKKSFWETLPVIITASDGSQYGFGRAT